MSDDNEILRMVNENRVLFGLPPQTGEEVAGCPHCAAALARAERAEAVLQNLKRPWFDTAGQEHVMSELEAGLLVDLEATKEQADSLRAELAQARAERDALEERAILAEREWGTWRQTAETVDRERFDTRKREVAASEGLAACRATLRELAEAVGAWDRLIYEGAPGQIAARKRLDAALARAEEEGRRDG